MKTTLKTWFSVLLNTLGFALSSFDENYFGSLLLESFHVPRQNIALKRRQEISDFNIFIKSLTFFLYLITHI